MSPLLTAASICFLKFESEISLILMSPSVLPTRFINVYAQYSFVNTSSGSKAYDCSNTPHSTAACTASKHSSSLLTLIKYGVFCVYESIPASSSSIMIQSDKVIDDISFVLHALTSVKKIHAITMKLAVLDLHARCIRCNRCFQCVIRRYRQI